MKDRVIQWLRDGGEDEAAGLLEQCTIEDYFVTLAFELHGERDWQITDIEVGAPRRILERVSGEYATQAAQIESAVRACIGPGAYVQDIRWVAKASCPQRSGNRRLEKNEAAEARSTILSQSEEQEFQASRFQSRLVIDIKGRMAGRKGNVVEVGGLEALLNDARLKLFLRLVLALYESPEGFLSKREFRFGTSIDGELVVAPSGLDQAISRLREPFFEVPHLLGGLSASQFIEVSRGRVRLSTHRRFVKWNREQLLDHPDEAIREITKRLPILGSATD